MYLDKRHKRGSSLDQSIGPLSLFCTPEITPDAFCVVIKYLQHSRHLRCSDRSCKQSSRSRNSTTSDIERWTAIIAKKQRVYHLLDVSSHSHCLSVLSSAERPEWQLTGSRVIESHSERPKVDHCAELTPCRSAQHGSLVHVGMLQ